MKGSFPPISDIREVRFTEAGLNGAGGRSGTEGASPPSQPCFGCPRASQGPQEAHSGPSHLHPLAKP
jgi:hypothetical protein